MKILNKRYDPDYPVDLVRANPRNVNEGDLGSISGSISENGWYGACIINERTGNLVIGEHRWRSAIGEGATTVPVLFIDCDEHTERKIMLADNRTNRLGSFNVHELVEELEALQSDTGSLVGTGFDPSDMQQLIDDLTKPLLFGDSTESSADKPKSPDNSDRVEGQTFEAPDATKKEKAVDTSAQLTGLAYKVIVECASEGDQLEALEKFESMGYTCKLLIS